MPATASAARDSTRQERNFDGRAALVTGAGTGIGRAVALGLADLGAEVLVTGRRLEPLQAAAAERPSIHPSAGDVTDPEDARRMVDDAVGLFGHLDVLINNAGVVGPTPLGGTDPEEARRTWATNVLGPTFLADAAVEHLGNTEGAIVNVSSTFGRKPAPGVSQYGASKAALEHLTRSWALELAPKRIRVNAVAPGPTESEALLRSGRDAEEIEAIKASERAAIPLGRRGEPEDVAAWIIAFADPASDW
jgi:NAD(P)-dependent dehydrogenase (short-subunit alcohol dehydrogenase family)